MKRIDLTWFFPIFLILLAGSFWAIVQPSPVFAQNTDDEIPRGAALFDNWWAALAKQSPQGDMPLWSRQSTNTRSGPDTWRCVTCHGWDYQGKDGAYRAGSNYTGFPGVYQAGQSMKPEDIVRQLDGNRDPSHDFTPYLSKDDLNALARFITTGLIDDNEFIDLTTLKVLNGNSENGQKLYEEQCASCHGKDGAGIKFRFEGMDATLGTLANQDPWRFLHKSRFGTPGTEMVIGYNLGWTPQDGRDVLKYAQSLPTGQEASPPAPVMPERPATSPQPPGGPATSFFTSLLTAISVMAAGLGFNILVAAALVGIILLLVWAIRSRK